MTRGSDRGLLLKKRFLAAAVFFILAVAAAAGIRSLLFLIYPTEVITDFQSLESEGLKLYGKKRDRYRVTGEDSHLYISPEDTRIRSVSIDIRKIKRPGASMEKTLEVYYDTGNGFDRNNFVQVVLKRGENRIYFDTLMPVRRIRIDFFNGTGYRLRLRNIILNPAGTGPVWILLLFGAAALALLVLASSGGRGSRFVLAVILWTVLMAAVGIPFVRCVRETGTMTALLLICGTPAMLLLSVLMMEEGPSKERLFTAAVCLCAFCLYACWSYYTPYAEGPDEAMHHDVVYYIALRGTLPAGYTPVIRNEIWGFSYAYLPILPFIIGGYIEFAALKFFPDLPWSTLVMLARSVSIISGTLTVYFSWKLAGIIFRKSPVRYAVPCIAGFLPEMAFLNTYVNSDAMAVMSTSVILYFWASGMEHDWRVRDAVGLCIGMAICALTYYNCYGFILMSIPLFFGTMYAAGKNRTETVRMTAFIVILMFALSGWWFIRNLILYDGDLLGRATLNRYAEIYAMDGFKPSQILSPAKQGESIPDVLFKRKWLLKTAVSFIAMFSRFLLRAKTWVYAVYCVFFGTAAVSGLAGFILRRKERTPAGTCTPRERKRKVFRICLVLSVVIVLVLAFSYSYGTDFQPQGRYIMPCIVPLALMLAAGFDALPGLVRRLRCSSGIPGDGMRVAAAVSVLPLALLLNVFLDTVFSFYIG